MSKNIHDLQRQQAFLRIFVFSLVTVIIWVGLSIATSQQRTTISPELIQLAEPLNPNINLETIQRIENKRDYSADELSGFPIFKVTTNQKGEEVITAASPQPAPVTIPVSSGSTQISLPITR